MHASSMHTCIYELVLDVSGSSMDEKVQYANLSKDQLSNISNQEESMKVHHW